MTQPNSGLIELALRKAGWVADGMVEGGSRPERAGLNGQAGIEPGPVGRPRGV